MTRRPARSTAVVLVLAAGAVAWSGLRVFGQAARSGSAGTGSFLASTAKGDWPSYTGDTRGTRYSPLAQITAANFNDLEVAWRFKTDNLGSRPEYKLEGTPLVVDGVL